MARRLKAARRAVDRNPAIQAYFANLVAEAAKQHKSRKQPKTIDVQKSREKVEQQRAKKGLTGVPYEPPEREAPPGPVEPPRPARAIPPPPKPPARAPEPSRPLPAPVPAKPQAQLTKAQIRAIQEKIIEEKLKDYEERKKNLALDEEEGYDYEFED